MKHLIKGRKFSRNSSQRKSLMRSLAIAFFQNETIKTTLPKAKELRPFVEKIISIARNDNLSNRRRISSILGNSKIVSDVFVRFGSKAKSRNGGYTRIIKCGFRVGDAAPMAIIQFVDIVLEKTEDNLQASN